MTRARDELILSHAADYGGGVARRLSPFVLEALDLPAAGGRCRAPACRRRRRSSASPRSTGRRQLRPSTPRPPSTEPLLLSFYAIDDYLSCPLKFKYGHVLRVPLAPHHALIYGSALHKAVQEFHRRHARGDVMTEEELTAAFERAWTNEGFLTRDHEEARLAAGRDAAPPVPRGAAEARTRSSRPTSSATSASALDGDRVRGRWDRVDIEPAGEDGRGVSQAARRRRTPTPSRRRSSLTGRERVTITDYKSSDVRDPVKARQRARESLQLQIYAMGYEALTGRLPDYLQLHFLDSGLVGRVEVDPKRLAKARAEDRGRGGRDAGPRLHRQAGPHDLRRTARSGRSARPAWPREPDGPRVHRRRSRSTSATRSCRSTGPAFGESSRPPPRRSSTAASARSTADAFLAAWAEERERQFREEVPQFREVDLAERLRPGARPPARDGRRRRRRSAGTRRRPLCDRTPAEIDWAVERVQRGLRARACPSIPASSRMLATPGPAARRWRSSRTGRSPRRSTATPRPRGWLPHLRAIVVSQRVGTIKPHPAIFAEAARGARRPGAGRDPPRRRRLGGGRRRRGRAPAGAPPTSTARPSDSPLPASERDESVDAGPRARVPMAELLGRCFEAAAARRRPIGHSPHWRSVRVGARMHRREIRSTTTPQGTEERSPMARDGPGDPRADQPDRTAGRAASSHRSSSSTTIRTSSASWSVVLRRAGAERDRRRQRSGRPAEPIADGGVRSPSLLVTDIEMPAMIGSSWRRGSWRSGPPSGS